MKIGCCVTLYGLRTSLAVLGIGLLIAGCGGGSSNVADAPDEGAQTLPDDDTGSMVTDLGEWNALTAGMLDIRDANDVLRAYYDSSGGHVMAGTPVQPAGMGSATWNGKWSGSIEGNPDPEAAAGLEILGVNTNELQALGGGARVTAYFENDGVQAAVTYQDIGLGSLGLSEITSDRAPVTGGRFRPEKTHTVEIPAGPIQLRTTGTFTGQGAFGGTDAEGVAGYIGGDISVSYGRGPRDLGTFSSVFYGTKDN